MDLNLITINNMEALTMYYKTITKLEKAETSLMMTTNCIKISLIENSIYKLFKELIDEMVCNIQKDILKGNTVMYVGASERQVLINKMTYGYGVRLNLSQRESLMAYYNNSIEKLIR